MRRKTKMKEMVKRVAVAVTAVAVIIGSVSAPATVEAKGTAFISKKVSKVTPTVKSAKRANGKITVTVTVPKTKVKKLGNVKKITVAYGSTKNSKKFEALKTKVKVTKKGTNKYTFTFTNKKLSSYKNAYMTVRFDGKSNWSKLVKVSGKATGSKSNYRYTICCNHCDWHYEYGPTEADAKKAAELHTKHYEDIRDAWLAKYAPKIPTLDDQIRDGYVDHLGFTVYGGSVTSN